MKHTFRNPVFGEKPLTFVIGRPVCQCDPVDDGEEMKGEMLKKTIQTWGDESVQSEPV